MPKLYEYFGIIILFYSNEHAPVHVHGKYQNKESKAEITVINGKILNIKFSRVKGKRPLPPNKLSDFKKIVNKYGKDIIAKWVDFFVYNKPVKPEIITKEIK